MPVYDITAHPLLNAKAKNLAQNEVDVFNAHVTGAEFIHNLDGTSFTGSDRDLAHLILVYQVNLQVSNDQTNELYKRAKEGDRDYEFRDQIAISDMAKNLRAKLPTEEDNTDSGSTKIASSQGVSNYPIW